MYKQVMNKVCKSCGEVKPVEEFGKHQRFKDKLNSKCKECYNLYQKKWREENPEKQAQILRKYYDRNTEQIKDYQKNRYKSKT